MDENHTLYGLKASRSSGVSPSLPLPGQSFPRVDEHMVKAEVTRDEIIGGRRMMASPAHILHATQHTQFDYILRAPRVPGYCAAADLLTRHDEESDLPATSVCSRMESEYQ